MTVTSQRRRRDWGVTCYFTPCAGSGRRRHIFLGRVDRVIDGDTLLVTADCGFDIAATKHLRLRGIDTPKLGSAAGHRARDFVQDMLAPVNSIILATHRTDRYRRYLADIRYLPGADDPHPVLHEGIFLNLQLLDEGWARPYA